MKVAFITSYPPYPLNTGGRIRTFHLLKRISQVHDMTLITAVGSRDDDAALGALKALIPSLAIRTAQVPPRHGIWRCGLRLARSLTSPLPYTWAAYDHPQFRANLQAALGERSFDVVHCDHTHIAHTLFDVPTPPRVLNAHNIESVIVERVAQHEGSPWRKRLIEWQCGKTRRAEANAHRLFDRSVVVSEVDRAALERLIPGLSVSIVPNGVEVEPDSAPHEQNPNAMVFVGAMDWLPNTDAVTFFVREVFPLIKRHVPLAQFWVVGRNPSPSVIRQQAEDGVHVVGTVDDVRPFLARARLVVVPLRIGGGTRLKILEAWAMRKPVLSTTIGAEGLLASDGANIALADAPAEMADRAVTLLTHPDEAAGLGEGGRQVVEQHFTWARVADRLLDAYDATVHAPSLIDRATQLRRRPGEFVHAAAEMCTVATPDRRVC